MLFNFDLTTASLTTGAIIWSFSWLLTRVPLCREVMEEAFYYLWKRTPLPLKNYVDLVYKALSCHKCTTFWATLFITANPVLALFLAALTDVLSRD